ncbi:MAG: Mur ligase family protein, partial [Clostridia bacterium]
MDKKALVLGYGISGKSAEKLLKKLGYSVTIYDDNIIGMNDKSVLNDNFCLAVYSPTFLLCNDVIKQLKIKSEDKKDSRKLTLKNKLLCNKSDTEYIFNNKLLINLKRFSRFYNIKLKKLKTPLLNKMRLINSKEGYYKNESIDASKNCIEIISETEFAIKNTKATIYAITGTNGKTTVTTLITEILKQKYRAVAAGNIGVPLSEYCLHLSEGDIAVLEISNFQLMGMKKFKPKMATILNITPDHIDVHKTFENYVNVKKSIFKEQDEEDISIINADESLTQA